MADEVVAGQIAFNFVGDSSQLTQAAEKSASALKGLQAATQKMGGHLKDFGGEIGKSASSLKDLGDAIGVNTSALERAGKRIENISGLAEKAGEMFGGMSKGMLVGVVAAGAVAVAATAGAAAIGYMTIEAGRQAEELDQLSQRTGISTRTIQAWSVAMAESNLDAQSLTTTMRTLSKNITQAHDRNSAAATTFEQLGIALHESDGAEEVIRKIADAFSEMPDGIEKSAAAVALLGRGGLQMIPFLNQGAAGFERSARLSKELGATLRDDQIKALGQADDAWDRVGIAMGGFSKQVGAIFAPAVATSLDWLGKLIGKANQATEAIGNLFSKVPELSASDLNKLPQAYVDKIQKEIDARQIAEGEKRGEPLRGEAIIRGAQTSQMLTAAGTQSLTRTLPDLSPAQAGAMSPEQLYKWETKRMEAAIGIVALREKEAKFAGAVRDMNRDIQAGLDKEQAVRNEHFALQLQQAEDVAALQFQKASPEQDRGMAEQVKNAQALMDLMPELAFHEANLLALHNSAAAHSVLDAERARIQIMQETTDRLSILADTEEAYAQNAAAAYTQLGSFFGDAQTAQAYAMDAIDARQQASIAALDQQLANGKLLWEDYHQRVLQLDLQADAQRRGVVQQFPTFLQKQLQDLVASNAFSVSQIVSTWTNGIANSIVKGGNFAKAAWESTQLALVQGALNTGVQLAAQWALRSAVEVGILSATNATKLGLQTAAASAEVAVNETKNGIIVASDTAAATASGGVWAGAAAVAIGAFGAVSSAISAMFAGMFAVVSAVGTFIMGVLTAIAEALTATVFGIPYAGAIMLGVVAIGLAIAAGVGAFAKGGIVTGPTLGLMGEAGSAEAAIPLNDRGAAFMAQTMGLSQSSTASTQTVIVPVYLNGREIARAVSSELPSSLRRMGVPA